MGVLWNREAPEKKVYSAYGMTVYGKVNAYCTLTRFNTLFNSRIEK